MFAPSSSHTSSLPHDKAHSKKKERPPALEIIDPSGADIAQPDHDHYEVSKQHVEKQRTNTSSTEDISAQATDITRSSSATSSLDPYYFSVVSPSGSPIPPVPDVYYHSKTPETRYVLEPATPVRDPASIDRRGLHGLGELATPRWTSRLERNHSLEFEGHIELDGVLEEGEQQLDEDGEEDPPDSPWTIEAVDGEAEGGDAPAEVHTLPKAIRARPSVTEESGGEEILYPRHRHSDTHKPSILAPALVPQTPSKSSSFAGHSSINAPPSAFLTPLHKAKKRTSDEFELDQSGTLIKKHQRTPSGSVADKAKDEKISARKHRSLGLGVGIPSSSSRDKGKERRRDTVAAGAVSKSERHARHASASSSSSSHGESHHPRRILTTDFSHLPPSPSSSSIQQFLRHTGSNGAIAPTPSYSSLKESQAHHSPNVAQSLLRGTQEGWSGLDDQATEEALRKLDGLSGKTAARKRGSVGSVRPGSSSRPGTPAKTTTQWEGVGLDGAKLVRRDSARDSVVSKDKDQAPTGHPSLGLGLTLGDAAISAGELGGSAIGSSDETQLSSPAQEKPKKSAAGARLSFTSKRGSASSTTYASTPTTSSRDSGSLSTATSLTSVSAQSGRHSTLKTGRNSGGSDISNSIAGDPVAKDRAASLVGGELSDGGELVPPVPPLPKDLSTYRSPPHSAASTKFPTEGLEGKDKDKPFTEDELDRTLPIDVPPATTISQAASPTPQTDASGHNRVQGYISATAPAMLKTPSKKWSFTNALGMKLSGSPSSPSVRDHTGAKGSPLGLSPRSATFGQINRRSESKDRNDAWSPNQPEAMTSAASLASMSSLSSVHALSPSSSVLLSVPEQLQPPDRLTSRRPGTASSANQSNSLGAQRTPLSPASSMRRGSSKRLTPSSIPFFRRSSSQSVQLNASTSAQPSTSPTTTTMSNHLMPPPQNSASPIDSSLSTPSVSNSAHKKTSMLSLGSLLKGSSSRRNLQGDKSDGKSGKESTRGRDTDKEKAERPKKDGEGRISVLMGRRRGKTLSSTDQKKVQPVSMPPMQISALPPATAQRVANLKAGSSSAGSSVARSTTISSRATSQTISSMQRQSDASLRNRSQLPTIAGSPSVGTAGSSNLSISREGRDPLSSSLNASTSNPKETPTKIPRINSRTSTVTSPALKGSASSSATMTNRRASINASGLVAPSTEPSPSPAGSTNEFGVLENGETSKGTLTATVQRQSIRASPSSNGTVSRQASGLASSSVSGIPRKGNRDSISFTGLRKSSTGSVASLTSAAPTETQHRFSALSPSKLKLLSPKVSLPHSRSTNAASNLHHAIGTPSSSRQSLSTPSPSPTAVDEEELLGDEEMMHYIKRQQQKKLSHGATQEELDEMLRFPEPLPPVSPSTPTVILKSSQRHQLSEYERKEISEYASVYCFGANSEKKPAHPDRTTNNFGYDDERGDYLVVDHDHLAYRYEIMGTLGKGSFGQVLSCRDHCTGESVAIKIIRNKKRFHHQALVEIKILDNLRKWDAEEKHHVIRMTEHFYFRGHLCIAMELLSINLYELIKANNFVGFTTALIRRFTSQMLTALSLMRHHRIVHCDLKPENVLLRHPAKSAIKVIDFGSSCFEHEKIYTYIQSRFYRSPEVIMGMNYHMAIDMWSLGCILAELHTGYPIFPGENEQEQLACIMEVLGVPDKDFVNRSSRKRLFFDSTGAPRPVVNSKGRRRRPGTKTLAQAMRCDDELFIDFVAKCLVWDPERRIKPQNAMRHPFLTAGRRPKMTTPAPGTAKALLASASNLSTRHKPTETPKKSQISAPTPLTARLGRTTNAVPTTPSGSTSMHTLGSARSYRTSQTQAMSSYHSSRTLNGFAVRAPSSLPLLILMTSVIADDFEQVN
ncbi:hypothetical protein EW146_g9392 [Bondarzewia mesenterica]|uniref:dual-specificity kinase n=1 Tax=Bondarzewia mesenterica TaxID=1095465 RepID=A0A4S4L6P6_9AGAM|nr:hypothetical protein EW146_g9392 [Bondarzewia mesenterica]